MNKISIGIVDDDSLVVNLLQAFLNTQELVDVIFTALNGEECLDKLRVEERIPEILLLDLKMKELNGIELTTILKEEFPSIKIIVVSSHYKRSFTGFMMKTGAAAFIPKGISPTELIEIIREVHEKGYFLLDDQLESIREQLSSKAPRPVLSPEDALSEREKEVLSLICQQKTAKEIGQVLHITQRTVEGHKTNLFMKTGAKNIAGLVIYAVRNEIIKIEDLPSF